ncbi:hypothetical protein FRACA_4730001 [Frankia canadensis]|uniref:Uncharacterized protein n=1 Tax=Frankia canadensis TaxID=1836972 RepID=A0A2I2KXW6_9ACTN|nr:hypothetical protein FRACA_4730001 [Frankia canadensis]SOU57791.1 hypothetical protein FRACA_4730001 [Frankia canadensis]
MIGAGVFAAFAPASRAAGACDATRGGDMRDLLTAKETGAGCDARRRTHPAYRGESITVAPFRLNETVPFDIRIRQPHFHDSFGFRSGVSRGPYFVVGQP